MSYVSVIWVWPYHGAFIVLLSCPKSFIKLIFPFVVVIIQLLAMTNVFIGSAYCRLVLFSRLSSDIALMINFQWKNVGWINKKRPSSPSRNYYSNCFHDFSFQVVVFLFYTFYVIFYGLPVWQRTKFQQHRNPTSINPRAVSAMAELWRKIMFDQS